MTVRQRRQREREERRTAIIEAAEEVFLEKGFWAATMDQVATRAELSKGTLYLYFKNKDDLFIAMGSKVLATLVERFEELSEVEHESGASLLRDLLVAYAETALARPGRFRLAVSWMVSEQEHDASTPAFQEHSDLVGTAMARIVAAIERGVEDCSLRVAAGPAAVATYIWASMIGALLIYSKADKFARVCPDAAGHEFNEEFITNFIDTLVSGLRAQETQR